jgi:hypothetical protein
MNEEWVSSCCCAPMDGAMIDISVCPDCKEWCEVVDLNEDEE